MKLYIMLIGLLICNTVYAQDWNVGAKAGINVSSISVKNASAENKSIFGLHLGGYANTSITDQIAMQPEVLFSLQGWETEGTKISVSYLSIPVVAKYSLVERFNVHAGPQISFLVSATDNFEEALTSIDISAVVGAEYQINDLFTAGVRYNIGLNNIREDLESTDIKVRSRVLQVSCGYKLNR